MDVVKKSLDHYFLSPEAEKNVQYYVAPTPRQHVEPDIEDTP
jgi:hypothetical protein